MIKVHCEDCIIRYVYNDNHEVITRGIKIDTKLYELKNDNMSFHPVTHAGLYHLKDTPKYLNNELRYCRGTGRYYLN